MRSWRKRQPEPRSVSILVAVGETHGQESKITLPNNLFSRPPPEGVRKGTEAITTIALYQILFPFAIPQELLSFVDVINRFSIIYLFFILNAEYADSSQRAQKQTNMCHLRPTLPGYDTMSVCDLKNKKSGGNRGVANVVSVVATFPARLCVFCE